LTNVALLLSNGVATIAPSSSSPLLDAQLLLAHVLGREREWMIAHGDHAPTEEEVERFDALCVRRTAGTPVAYLLGSCGFYGREFLANEHVLVPRPETEHLVDEALAFIRGSMRVLDVGCGSGAIACTIAAESEAFVDATDTSREAIEIAVNNARRLGVAGRCRFHHGNLADPVRFDRFDVIIANLPYIPSRDLPPPPNPASFEPRTALDGGPDGLTLYRALLRQLPPLLNEESLILLEAAPPTIRELADLVRSTLPNFTIEEGNDYAGLPRYIKATASPVGATFRSGGV
jgi:release factor glutamine methyltransferase